jgi:hypothetical protein
MSAIDNWLGWDKLSWPKKILIALPLLAAVLGWQYYSRNNEAAETHAKMIGMCGDDKACVAAVDQYSEACFKDNYSMGRRRQGVRMDDFVSCVNEKSGVQHFEVVKDSR